MHRLAPIAAILTCLPLPVESRETAEDRAKARKDAVKKIDLRIESSGWGNAGHKDLTAVLKSACSELAVHFDETALRRLEPIRVKRGQSGPITHYQRTIRGEIMVLLSSKDRFWCQHAYQMAHELGHILCGFKKGDKTNLWFEESLCELASIYAVRRMSYSWQTNPPYPNWRDYSKALDDYADDLIAKYSLPSGTTLKSWYAANREVLSRNATNRELNGRVAVWLLPIFEKNPEHWRTVTYLNKGRGSQPQTFKQYLAAWHEHCPDEHKPLVAKLRREFGVIE